MATVKMFGGGNISALTPGDIAFWSERDPISLLIRWVTRGKFDHVEVVSSYSASIGAKWDGVKIHQFADIPGTITIFHLDNYDPGKLAEGLDMMLNAVGSKYDLVDFVLNLWAIVRPKGPFPRTPQKYTCSELVGKYLVTIEYPGFTGYTETDLQVLNPNEMARQLGMAV